MTDALHSATVFLLLSAIVLLPACAPPSDAPVASEAMDTLAYVGRETCAGCHAGAAENWHDSDHDRAMEEATAETVLGDFDDAAFTSCGVTTRFFQEDGDFFIRTQGEDGTMQTYSVAYTFGYTPLQQYLIPFDGGRMQAFTIAWDTERQRWFSLQPDECIEPPDWLHWTGEAMNWNYMCADCHSTNLQRNFDLASDTYETTWSEIDVSCEACHGPGEAHVERARSDDYDAEDGGLTVRLTEAHRQVDTCAPCHARRRTIHPDHLAGKPFLDHYEPELLEEELYFADGQIRDEVYVYGSFLQSRMYANGVTCSDCHDPHSTDLKFEGNALCTQCHEPATYDSFEHVRHPQGSEGAQCVDCHMPERTYMVVDPRRDHSFKVPRPDLTAELGTPNACNGCHADESAGWAAEHITEWHGQDRPPSFARAIAGGREGAPEAEPELYRLAGDFATPDIVRATALSLLERYPTVRAADAAVDLLQDSSAVVRATALRNLAARNLSAESDRQHASRIEPLLTDSVRLVRTEAARVLTMIAPERFGRESTDGSTAESTQGSTAESTAETTRAYWSALQEYRAGQLALSEQAAAHLNLAVIHEQLGALDSAATSYETALRMDSTFVPAHLNLAMLYNRMRQEAGDAQELGAAAERSLRAAVRLQPEMAQAHYTLGLLLAERPEAFEEAAGHLLRAAELDTANPRIQYNAGLAHQQLGDAETAERLLLNANRLAPDHPDYLNALSVFYAQQEEWETALTYTDRLLQQFPDNADIRQRADYIRQQMNR